MSAPPPPPPSNGHAHPTPPTPPAKVAPQRGVRRIRAGRVAVAAACVGLAASLALAYGLSPTARTERGPAEVRIDLRKTNGELAGPPGLPTPPDGGYESATRDPNPPRARPAAGRVEPEAKRPTDPPATPPAAPEADPESARLLADLREQNDAMNKRLAEYQRALDDELAEAKRQADARKAAVDAPITFASVKSDDPRTSEALAAAATTDPSPALSDVGDPLNPIVVTPSGDAAINPNEVQPRGTRSNLQTEKIAFLDGAERGLGTYLRTGPTGPIAPEFELSAGTAIPGFTVTALNTDLPGKVVGRVSGDVYDSATGRYVLVPQGSVAVGEYSSLVSNGQNRVLIAWELLTFPDGRSVELPRQPGTDGAGASGLADAVDYHLDKLLVAGGVSAAVAVGGQLAEGRNGGIARGESVEEQVRELVFGGASDTASRVADKVIDRQLDVQPTITVRPGWRFNILLTRNLVLEPYVDSRR